jgi:hypothetical protein
MRSGAFLVLRLLCITVLLAALVGSGSLILAKAQSVADIVQTVKPAVVFINVPQPDGSFASGSGFLISPDGYILTAYHVIHDAKRIFVRLANGDRQEAQVIGSREETDSTLLKIPGSNYPAIPLGDSSKLRQGDEVLVFGYPGGRGLGIEEVTVTRGIISAFRSQGLVIQIDAAVNPGNSGGPVVTLSGLAVGIAYAKIPQFTNINFAVSVEGARPLLLKIPGGQPVPVGPARNPTGVPTPYFPTNVGLSREYLDEQVTLALPSLTQTKVVQSHETTKITNVWSDNGDTVAILQVNQTDPPRSVDVIFRITSRGIFREHQGSDSTQFLTPDLVMPLPLREGVTWDVKMSVVDRLGTTSVDDISWQVSQVGGVYSTPAGTFDDCATLEAKTDETSSNIAAGYRGHIMRSQEDVYCKDVGLVFAHSATDGTPFRFDTTLTSFSKP